MAQLYVILAQIQGDDSVNYAPLKINEQICISELYSLFEIKYEYGFSFPGETHNFWECMYILGGSVCVSADERIYNLKSGDIIFHKPMDVHKFNVDSPGGARLFIFSFSMTGALTEFFEDKVFRLSAEQAEIISDTLGYIHRQMKKATGTERVAYYSKYLIPFEYSQSYPQMIQTYIYRLLLSLSENNTVASASSEYTASIFREAVDYMNDNVCEQLKVADIAKHCSVSVSGLKRIFEKYAGIGVHKYLIKLKIKKAADMLGAGMTVTDAAEKLGFSSQGYFSAVFKRETGTSPSRRRD